MNFFTWLLERLGFYKKPSTTTTTTMRIGDNNTDGKIKVGIIMGINDYPGTQNDLNKCVKDANDWKNILDVQYKFDHVYSLLNSEVTLTNFSNKVLEIAKQNPDLLVICYSGHGTSVADSDGDEADSKDECWCFYDGIVRDDNIRKVLDQIPITTTTVIFSDSCFSGTVTRAFLNAMNDFDYVSIPKYMPPKDDMDSAKLSMLPINKSIFVPKVGRNEILFSGCSNTEYSYEGDDNGAATKYWLQTLMENSSGITYGDFYKKTRTFLPNSRFPQTPQFEPSNDEMATKILFE